MIKELKKNKKTKTIKKQKQTLLNRKQSQRRKQDMKLHVFLTYAYSLAVKHLYTVIN